MPDTIHGFPAELPIGILSSDGESRQKEFSLIKVGEVTETIITNDAFRRNHPQKWLCRLISSFVEHIGSIKVYSEFRSSKFKEIPKAVAQLPIADAGYLLALGHMNTYGPDLDVGIQECDECGRKTKYDVDLRKMKLKEDSVKDPNEFWAQLPNGFLRPEGSTASEKVLPYTEIRWNRYFFRPPTLADAIAHEKHWTRTNMVNFNMRVLCDALVKVESWEDDGEGNFSKTGELETKFQNMEGHNLFNKLDSADRRAIRATVNKLPALDMDVVQECSACGEDIELDVDTSNFFPLA